MRSKDSKIIGINILTVPALSLFTSAGTLICCALPALMVSLGMGAVLAGLVSAVPQMVWLSEHKALVFCVAGAMIIMAGIMQYRTRHLPCPADQRQAAACNRLRKISLGIYAFSVVAFLIGAFFAFAAPYILVK